MTFKISQTKIKKNLLSYDEGEAEVNIMEENSESDMPQPLHPRKRRKVSIVTNFSTNQNDFIDLAIVSQVRINTLCSIKFLFLFFR